MNTLNNAKFVAIFKDDKTMILWGFAKGETLGDAMALANEWKEHHRHVLSTSEATQLMIAPVEVTSKKLRNAFMTKYSDYEIIREYGMAITKYEKRFYDEPIDLWYEMYQNIIIGSQVIPDILTGGTEIQGPLNHLRVICEHLYNRINNRETFVRYLSTIQVKNMLITHPGQVLMQLADEDERLALFRYQLFKDDKESEVKQCED